VHCAGARDLIPELAAGVAAGDARRVAVGSCEITGGSGSYGTAIDLPVHTIQRVELVKPGGPP
jgi:hypothetical protein